MYLWAAVQHTIEQPALSEGAHVILMAESMNSWYAQLLLPFSYQRLLGNNVASGLQTSGDPNLNAL